MKLKRKMRPRVALARLLIDLKCKFRFLEKLSFLPVLFMRPDDLLEFSRRGYARPRAIENWSDKIRIDEGFRNAEKAILEKIALKEGRILVLCSGGGRDAISLGRLGFDVTVVDFVPEMVEKAIENARKEGIKISGLIQDMSRLDVPEGSYDIVWLFEKMYSSIPTRRKRVKMLKKIRRILKPGGFFVCQFLCETGNGDSSGIYFLKKILACLTLGNFLYENGDMLLYNSEFIRLFSSENELRAEFEKGKFEVDHIHFPSKGTSGEALLRRLN